MGLGAAREEFDAAFAEGGGKCGGRGEHLLTVGTELRLCGCVQGKAEGGEVVHVQGAVSCICDGGIHACGELLFAEQDGAVRSAEGIVRRETHDIGARDGRGDEPRRDEPDTLSDVHPEIGAHGTRDFGEPFVVRYARIADGGEDDEARAHARGELHDLVPVHALCDGVDAEALKMIVQSRAVLLLPAVKGEDGIPRVQQCEKCDTRGGGDAPEAHDGVLAAEQILCACAYQLLDGGGMRCAVCIKCAVGECAPLKESGKRRDGALGRDQ